jgi:hypothetical protein
MSLRSFLRARLGKAVLEPSVGLLSDYNTTMENAIRLSAYKAGLDKGMSKEQAASLAKNLTVNFNKKGQISNQMPVPCMRSSMLLYKVQPV